MNYMEAAFAPAEAMYREQVIRETWGHLAPEKNKTYRGHIVIAVGCFGDDHLNPTVILCEFPNLEDSPWFYDAVMYLIDNLNQTDEPLKYNFQYGKVYRIDATFRNYQWWTKWRELSLS